MYNNQRKFRDIGSKAGAKLWWDLLQKSALGQMIQKKARRGTDMVLTLYIALKHVITCIYVHIHILH